MSNISQEILEFIKLYNLDNNKIHIDSKGLITYTGDIILNNLSIEKVPTALKSFKAVLGTLSFYRCKNLKDLTALQNIQTILKDLNLSETSISSFLGLESLESIGKDLNISKTPLQSFMGLSNLKEIGGHLYCFKTDIKTFDGLPKDIQIKNVYKNPNLIFPTDNNINERFETWKSIPYPVKPVEPEPIIKDMEEVEEFVEVVKTKKKKNISPSNPL